MITRTITQSKEIDKELEKTIEYLNSNRISGKITKSKIIRLAILDFIKKQEKIKAILNDENIDTQIKQELNY